MWREMDVNNDYQISKGEIGIRDEYWDFKSRDFMNRNYTMRSAQLNAAFDGIDNNNDTFIEYVELKMAWDELMDNMREVEASQGLDNLQFIDLLATWQYEVFLRPEVLTC